MADQASQDHHNRFRSELLARLEPPTPDLTAALQDVITRSFPKRVRRLEFRVIEDDLELGGAFPIVLDLPTSTEELLEHEPPLCPPDWIASYDALDPEAGCRDYAAEIVAEWFAGCWRDAGGRSFPLPAIIGTRDSVRQYDLTAGEWLGK